MSALRGSLVLALSVSPVLAVGPGCARPEPTRAPSFYDVAAPGAVQYQIGSDDVLRVSVWRQPELTLDSVVVRPDGRISVPLIDDVKAAGRTPEELKREIGTRLADFVREPAVTVVVLESRSKRVYVTGEVQDKGVIPLVAGMRIFDAIAVAGGLALFADPTGIRILREEAGGIAEFTFDYNAYARGDDLEQNILLRAGDRIIVPGSSVLLAVWSWLSRRP